MSFFTPFSSLRRSLRTPRAGSRTAVLVIFAATLALSGCSSSGDNLAQQWEEFDDQEYISEGGAVDSFPPEERAEPVEYTGITDSGESLNSSAFRGSVTVINFWYAACPPCQAEAPDLAAAHKKFSEDGVRFIGVNAHDGEAQSLQFADHFGIEYPSFIDAEGNRSIQRAFVDFVPLNAVPTTLVLDHDGRVAHRFIGQINDVPEFHEVLRGTLEEG